MFYQNAFTYKKTLYMKKRKKFLSVKFYTNSIFIKFLLLRKSVFRTNKNFLPTLDGQVNIFLTEGYLKPNKCNEKAKSSKNCIQKNSQYMEMSIRSRGTERRETLEKERLATSYYKFKNIIYIDIMFSCEFLLFFEF